MIVAGAGLCFERQAQGRRELGEPSDRSESGEQRSSRN